MAGQIWLSFVAHYGYAGISTLLALGIVGIPVPDEILLTYGGFLVHKGTLSLFPTIIFSVLGSSTGITISYLLGRFAGKYIIKKYGGWLGLSNEKVNKMHSWFERFGKWLLIIGYYIAGVRHVTAFAAGMLKYEFAHFAMFAYSGAILWCSTFILLGFYFGEEWAKIAHLVHQHLLFVSVIIIMAAATYYGIRIFRAGNSDKKGNSG